MIGFFIFLHATVCIFLTLVVLMQAGRGGGLTEGFASAESMFGARTNDFMVRTTAIFTAVFLTTGLSLAYLSAQKGKSIIPTNVAAKRLPDVTIPISATDLPSGLEEDNALIPVESSDMTDSTVRDNLEELPLLPEVIDTTVDNRVE